MKTMQCFVNCDIPGFQQIEYDTVPSGSSYTAQTVTGWHSFKDYLAQITAELPNSWVLQYNTTSDRVECVSGSGTIRFRLQSQSMADLLGLSGLETGPFTGSFSFPNAPKGIVPLQSLHISEPISGNKPTLRTFRHDRSYSFSFGSAISYKVETRFDSAHIDRVQSGPLLSGKLRFGDFDAAKIYSSGDLGGSLDGFILQQNQLSLLNEEVSIGAVSDLTVIVPDTAHSSSEGLADAFWSNLERGYSLNYFATIEGVPFRFIEHDVGFSSGDYTDSFTLIVDGSQKAHYKIDRFKGLAAASGVTFGVLDPQNSLNIFERASVQIPVSAAVAYNATTITLSSDSTDFSSSGFVYLGKEALKFTANTGPSGTPANQLQGITRPFGPGYDYGTKSTEKFRTVTNRKRVWDGCEVSLRAMLIDPFGRAVGSTYADSYQKGVFSGEVDGVPGYDAGVWVVQTRDLLRRLTRKVGEGACARTAPSATQQTVVLTGDTFSEPAALWCRTKGSERLTLEVIGKAPSASGQAKVSYEVTLSALNLPSYHTLYEGMEALIAVIRNLQLTPLSGDGLISSQVSILHFADAYEFNEDGTVSVGFAFGAVSGADYNILSINISGSLNHDTPHWLPRTFTIFDGNSSAMVFDEIIRSPIENFTGFNHPHIVLKQPPNSATTLGTFSSSGFALLEGDNDFRELIKYTSKSDVGIPNRIVLQDCTRNISGQAVNVFKGEREIKEAIRQGTLAESQTATLGALACNILESSGNNLERGAFDVLPVGFGYGLKASNHVYDDPTTLPRVDLAIASALNFQADMVITGGISFEEYFGGTAAAMGLCFAWVRDGNDLRIGCVGTFPGGNAEEYTITDSDLLAGSSVEIVKVASGPNEVIVEQSESPAVKSKSSYTYRVVEDMLSRGTVSQKVSLYGLSEAEFYAFAKSIAVSLVNNSSTDIAYRLKVKPGRDYLAGQACRLDITHPSVFDWKANSTGISDVARVTEVQRDLTNGQCSITVMTSATTFFPALCPVAVVTAYDGSGSNGVITCTDASLFVAGEVVRVYNPGMGIADEKSILSVDTSAKTLTISGLLAFVPTNNFSCCTYPLNTNAGISPRQDSHAHVLDGGSYV